jgi:hypothetical protein
LKSFRDEEFEYLGILEEEKIGVPGLGGRRTTGAGFQLERMLKGLECLDLFNDWSTCVKYAGSRIWSRNATAATTKTFSELAYQRRNVGG